MDDTAARDGERRVCAPRRFARRWMSKAALIENPLEVIESRAKVGHTLDKWVGPDLRHRTRPPAKLSLPRPA
jgi:hypothetical protein